MSMPSITTNTSSSLPMEQYPDFDGANFSSSFDAFNNALAVELSPTSPTGTGLTPPLPQPNVSPAPSNPHVEESSENTEFLISSLRFATRTATHARTNSSPSPTQLLEQIHGGRLSGEQPSGAPGLGVAPSALHATSTPQDYTTQVDFQAFFDGLGYSSAIPLQTDPSFMTQQAFAAPNFPLYAAGQLNVLTTEGIAPNGITWGVQTRAYTTSLPPSLGVPHLSPAISPSQLHSYQPRQMPSNLASPSLGYRSVPSPQLSTPSPRISRHGRMLSTASVLSSCGSVGLNAPSPSVALRPTSSSDNISEPEDHEESGSSTYSPWSIHNRQLSACFSESLSPSIALQHLATTSVSSTSATSKPKVDRADTITVEQWMDTSLGPGAASYALASSSSSGPRQSVEPPKKRKRLSHPVPQIDESVWKAEDDEDASSEDEFTFAAEEDSTDSDGDFEEKGRKRSAKKRRVSVSASSPASSHSHSHGTAKPNSMVIAAPNYGQDVKVHTLFPIDRKTKCCPHCGFVPSNGRFSDLKRHHQKHLIDGCAGKEMWVCTLCGDIEEEDVAVLAEDGSQTGEVKKMKIYYPNTSMAGKIVKYTRKDSAKRHWLKEHGDRGMTFQPSHLAIVDDVKEESQ